MDAYGFKFQIGDIVAPVGSIPFSPEEFSWDQSRGKFHIIGRLLEECPGGIQRHYDVRSRTAKGSVSMPCLKMTAIELRRTTTHAEDVEARKAYDENRKAAK